MTTGVARRSSTSTHHRPARSRLPPAPASPRALAATLPAFRFLRLSIFAHDLIRKPVPTFRDNALQSLGHLLVSSDKRALLFEPLLQLFDGNVSRNRIARQRQRRRHARRLPH